MDILARSYETKCFNKCLNMLAVYYGASSCRAVIGQFDGYKLDVKEIHRISNDPFS